MFMFLAFEAQFWLGPSPVSVGEFGCLLLRLSLLRKPSKIASFCHTSSMFHHLSGFHPFKNPYLFCIFGKLGGRFIRKPPRIGGEHLRGHRLPPPCGLRGGLLCRPRLERWSGGAGCEIDICHGFLNDDQ